MIHTALTIAGSDCSGGAGVQADIKTMSALGVYAMSVITAVTAQNTLGVAAVEDISPEVIQAQMDAVFGDIPPDAVKIGMVSRKESIAAIADKLAQYQPQNVVLDPVMVSKSGCHLLQPDAVQTLIKRLLPLSRLVTPNIPEAEVLTGGAVTAENWEDAARAIYQMGPDLVLIKGGHLKGEAADLLYDGSSFEVFPAARIDTRHTHGTGCTLSSAIAACLAKGAAPRDAVRKAKDYITGAIARGIPLGHGVGPVHHFYRLWQEESPAAGQQKG